MYLNFLNDNQYDNDLVFKNDLFDEKSFDIFSKLNSESFNVFQIDYKLEDNFVESSKIFPSKNYSKDELSLKTENVDSVSDKDKKSGSKNKSTFSSSSSKEFIQKNQENFTSNLFKAYKVQKVIKKKIEKNIEKKDNNYINKKRENKTKRGRQYRTKKKKEHKGIDFDNMLVKIQNHYLSFIINFSNDVSATVLGNEYKYSFKNIDRSCKINIKYDYINQIKSEPIQNILKLNINNKYKYFGKNYNSESLHNLCKKSNWLKNTFFKMNYLELFNYYYNKGNLLKEVNIEGKNIILSKKTKSFSYLIDNNKGQKEYLFNAAKLAYFNGHDGLNPEICFTTFKNEINNE